MDKKIILQESCNNNNILETKLKQCNDLVEKYNSYERKMILIYVLSFLTWFVFFVISMCYTVYHKGNVLSVVLLGVALLTVIMLSLFVYNTSVKSNKEIQKINSLNKEIEKIKLQERINALSDNERELLDSILNNDKLYEILQEKL